MRVELRGEKGRSEKIAFELPDIPSSWIQAIEDLQLNSYPIDNCIMMKTAQNTYSIGWLASQTDMLSDDWEIIEE